ncbi:hypothetical protein [Tistrella mobilis]|uniref:hypothetical protein n=1 Tax=Tistrella mobilis TaxID=171437 RepID=UPI0018D47A95|nr:hypothetical protein [Tistrella mobilis]
MSPDPALVNIGVQNTTSSKTSLDQPHIHPSTPMQNDPDNPVPPATSTDQRVSTRRFHALKADLHAAAAAAEAGRFVTFEPRAFEPDAFTD